MRNTAVYTIFLFYCIVPVVFADQKTGNADHTIRLKSRQFTPTRQTGHNPEISGYTMIQFEEMPSEEIFDQLADQNIKILQMVSPNTVMAHIPSNQTIDFEKSHIRWLGKLKPADKCSRHLHKSLEKGYVLVDVFPDVNLKTAHEIIKNANGEIVENPYLHKDTYLVRTDSGIVKQLSEVEEICWIWPASEALINGEPVYSDSLPETELGPVAIYAASGNGWDGPGLGSYDLTFCFEGGTLDIPGDLEYQEVERALREWSYYADVTFTETDVPDLYDSFDIFWAIGAHGDGSPFEPGGALAHAFPPQDFKIGGDIHFNDYYDWSIDSGYDVFSIALHEAGHALGMGHSDDPDAVMYPYISMGDVFTGLHNDDIAGIQSIYLTSPAKGGLRVLLESGEAISEGVMWRLTSGPDTSWKQSGQSVFDLPAVSYTLEFADLSGWLEPDTQTITISRGGLTEQAAYIHTPVITNMLPLSGPAPPPSRRWSPVRHEDSSSRLSPQNPLRPFLLSPSNNPIPGPPAPKFLNSRSPVTQPVISKPLTSKPLMPLPLILKPSI